MSSHPLTKVRAILIRITEGLRLRAIQFCISILLVSITHVSASATEVMSGEHAHEWLKQLLVNPGDVAIQPETFFYQALNDTRESQCSDLEALSMLGAVVSEQDDWLKKGLADLSQSSQESHRYWAETWLAGGNVTAENLFLYLTSCSDISIPIELIRWRPTLLNSYYVHGSFLDYHTGKISASDGVLFDLYRLDNDQFLDALQQAWGQDASCNTGTMIGAQHKRDLIIDLTLDVYPRQFLAQDTPASLDLKNFWIGVWQYSGAYERQIANKILNSAIELEPKIVKIVVKHHDFNEIEAGQIARGYLDSRIRSLTERISSYEYNGFDSQAAMFEAFHSLDVDAFIETDIKLTELAAKAAIDGDAVSFDRIMRHELSSEPGALGRLASQMIGQNQKAALKIVAMLTSRDLEYTTNRFLKNLAMLAAQYNELETLQALVDRFGTQPFSNLTAVRSDWGWGCMPENLNRGVLSYAAENGDSPLIKLALELFPEQKEIEDLSGRRAVDYLEENSRLAESERDTLYMKLK